MRYRLAGLMIGLSVAPGTVAQAPAPSVELLLYLADWEPDERGRLTDPMEIPADDAEMSADESTDVTLDAQPPAELAR